MATNYTRIYNGVINPNSIAVSDTFKNCTGIYLINNIGTDEIAIDAYLQLKLQDTYRVIPLHEQEINSEVAYTLPSEYVGSDLELSLVMITSAGVNITVYVYDTDCCNTEELKAIKEQLDRIESNSNSGELQEFIVKEVIVPIGLSLLTGNPLPLLTGLPAKFLLPGT